MSKTAILPGDLDLSGWDLKKALQLLAKGNICLMEWLGSPIIDHANPNFLTDMRSQIPSCFNAIGACHHYLSTAIHVREAELCDILRRWIQ